MALELDYMEYANDGAAQAAYVSSDVAKVYGSDVTPNMTDHNAPIPNVVSADSEAGVYYSWKAFNGVKNAHGWITGPGEAVPTWIKFDLGNGQEKTVTKYAIWGAPGGDENRSPKNWTFEGSNNDSDWDILDTIINETAWGAFEKREFAIANSTAYRYYKIAISANNGGGDTSITEIELYKTAYEDALQCYSEDTIKQQGSYSLKIVAAPTASLNDTLTKSGLSIDLSGIQTLELYGYASRTGTNISISIHDSGGTTTTKNIVIGSAGAWEKTVWDISGVADADKDDIDSIIIKIIEASALNTFYVDNFYGVEIVAWPTNMLNKNRISGYHCFMDAYLRASRAGLTPLKLPDGTVF